jgi:hypothetical protein
MKIKLSIIASSLLLGSVSSSNAAIFAVGNVIDFQTDTLYATSGNVPMTSGIVAVGYFGSTIVDTDLDTIPELFSLLGTFPTQSAASPGSVMGTFGIGIAGYADNADLAASMGQINLSSNASLLGRTVYSIVTDASSLETATATSGFALVRIGTIQNDEGGELTYGSNPAGITPLIGTNGTLFVDLGIDFDGAGGEPALPASTYSTLKLSAIPEPSSALLGAIGAIALLRRRRN